MSLLNIFIFALLIATTPVQCRGGKRKPPSTTPRINGNKPELNHLLTNNFKQTTKKTTTTEMLPSTTQATYYTKKTNNVSEYNYFVQSSYPSSEFIASTSSVLRSAIDDTISTTPPDEGATMKEDPSISMTTLSLNSGTSPMPEARDSIDSSTDSVTHQTVPIFYDTILEEAKYGEADVNETEESPIGTEMNDINWIANTPNITPESKIGFNHAETNVVQHTTHPTTETYTTTWITQTNPTITIPVNTNPSPKPEKVDLSLQNSGVARNVRLQSGPESGSAATTDGEQPNGGTDDPDVEVPEHQALPSKPEGPNPCKYYQHMTTQTYTCCRGRTYPVSEKFQKSFQKCYLQSKKKGEETTIHDTLWELYGCMWSENANRGFTATAMYNVYAKTFSREVAEEIEQHLKELQKEDVIPKGVQQIEDRKKLRAMYFHVERGVCEKNYSPPVKTTDKNFLNCKDISAANSHERGDCCHGKPVPIRLDYFRQIDTSEKTCVKIPNANLTFSYQDSSMQQMCTIYCDLLGSEWLPSDTRLLKVPAKDYVFPLKEALDRLLSPFSPDRKTELKQAMDLEMDPRNFTTTIFDNLESNNLLKLGSLELAFEEELIRLTPVKVLDAVNQAEIWLIKCESWNVLVRKLETALYSYCYSI